MKHDPNRPRSEKDVVPKHKSGADALEWLEAKLDGSWTDALDAKPGEETNPLPEVEEDDPFAEMGITLPKAQTPEEIKKDMGMTPDPVNEISGGFSPEPLDTNVIGPGTIDNSVPLDMMTPEQIAERIEKMWKLDGESS